MAIERLDHFVLTVRNLDATCRFYRDVLGMNVVTFGQGRLALRFGQQKINLHEAGGGNQLVAGRPEPGSADVCFITTRPLAKWVEHFNTHGVTVIEGPGRRSGAEGPIDSIYVRDPDQNLVEISVPVERGGELAPIRAWLTEFAGHVRAVDFESGRAMCAPDLLVFGTYAEMVEGVDHAIEQQWKKIWPTIRNFTIKADQARGVVAGNSAWVAAPWDSLGVRDDGSTFYRPGRLTIIFERRDGRWLARHTHFSLTPTPAAPRGDT